jgi:hypothetical protein
MGDPPATAELYRRLSYLRDGAEDWAPAQRNLALAPGDAFYAGNGAHFEVRTRSCSFVRAEKNSRFSRLEQDEHCVLFKQTSGRVSFDMGSMVAADAVELSTPGAVFVFEHPPKRQAAGTAWRAETPPASAEAAPQRGEDGQDGNGKRGGKERPLPVQPAGQPYRGHDRMAAMRIE